MADSKRKNYKLKRASQDDVPRDARGRWLPGRTGNVKGIYYSKKKEIYNLLIMSSADLLEEAINKALGGDNQMLIFLLSRIFPRQGIISSKSPDIQFLGNPSVTLQGIMRSLHSDEISSSEADELLGLLQKQIEVQSSDLFQLMEKFSELKKKLEEKDE